MPPKRPPPDSHRDAKRARSKQFRTIATQSSSASSLPPTLEVERHVKARAFEIKAMEHAMQQSQKAGMERAFQSLPRHLRRRAASHDVRRLPQRLRAKAKREMINDKSIVKKKKKLRDRPALKRRMIIKLSHPARFAKRQLKKGWLETHIWHAKRMRMVDIWGHRLAEKPTMKAFRASFRASQHGVIVHDASYTQNIELRGPYELLAQILRLITDISSFNALSTSFTDGSRCCNTSLYAPSEYPFGFIGPLSILWAPSTKVSDRQLLLRYHPSIKKAARAAIKKAMDIVNDENEEQIAMFSPAFVAFDITGPQSSSLLQKCLRVKGSRKSTLASLPPPASIPKDLVIGLRIFDPRLTFPNQKSPASKPPVTLIPSTHLANVKSFWKGSERLKISKPTFTKSQLDARRSQQLVPGSDIEKSSKEDVIPILLVQNTQGSSKDDAITTGWTILAPAGWGMPIWLSLVHADTRIAGLQAIQHQAFESGHQAFPQDFTTTEAFALQMQLAKEEAEKKHRRTPPAHRPNYGKLQTHSPFSPDFDSILKAAAARCGVEEDLSWQLKGPNTQKIIEHLMDCIPATSTSFEPSHIDAIAAKLHLIMSNLRKKAKLTHEDWKDSKTLLASAIVAVKTTQMQRGDPADNAMIYQLSKEQMAEASSMLANVGKRNPVQDDDDEEEKSSATIPSGENIIGYVTTGKFSLKQGRGHAIATLSLLAYLEALAATRVDDKISGAIVGIRNPTSTIVRYARVVAIE